MYIFNIWEVLLNIAFPYAALNVYIPHIAVLFSGIYLYFRKSQAGQMEFWSPAKIHTCSQMVMDMSQDYEQKGAWSVKMQLMRPMK